MDNQTSTANISTPVPESEIPTLTEVTPVEPDLCATDDVLKKRWLVTRKLGAGCFGQIYLVRDNLLSRYEALKAEAASKGDRAQLPMELQVLKKYQGKSHATELYGAGTQGEVNFIVMQWVGDNLAHLRRNSPANPKRYSLSTTVRLSRQCLEAINQLHSVCVIHRDIKPSNFAMGRTDTQTKNNVFLLDFGLARFFADGHGVIRPERKSVGFRGTMRYCSLTAHNRRDLGRKDDLISMYYMMVEFWKGHLPWRGARTAQEVLEDKRKYNLNQLTPELPQLQKFAEHLNSLQFASQPNYELMMNLLQEVMDVNKIYSTDLWDWENDYRLVVEEEDNSETQSDNDI